MTRLWTAMKADHDLVWRLINQLTGGPGEPHNSLRDSRRIAQQLVALESVHEAAEEQVIWPAVRQHCPDGDELISNALDQETGAKRTLNELRRISPGTGEFNDCLAAVAGQARTHLSFEEAKIWPQLARHLSDAGLDRLADQWDAARRSGPTRPHPHTPAQPGLLATAGRLLAVTDRGRDLLTGRRVPAP